MDVGTSIYFLGSTPFEIPEIVTHQGNIRLGLVSVYILRPLAVLSQTNELHLVPFLFSNILQIFLTKLLLSAVVTRRSSVEPTLD